MIISELWHFQGQKQCGPSSQVARCLSFTTEDEAAIVKHTSEMRQRNLGGRQAMIRQSLTSTDPSLLVQEIRKLEQLQRQLGEEANRALEVLHKEVASHRLGGQATTETIAKMLKQKEHMQQKVCFYSAIKKAIDNNTPWPSWDDCIK